MAAHLSPRTQINANPSVFSIATARRSSRGSGVLIAYVAVCEPTRFLSGGGANRPLQRGLLARPQLQADFEAQSVYFFRKAEGLRRGSQVGLDAGT